MYLKERLGISEDHHIHSGWRGDLKSHRGTEVCISLKITRSCHWYTMSLNRKH